MVKNILIIGGSYFLGRVTVEALSSDQTNRVWVVNRGNCPLHLPNVTEIICDRNNTLQLKDLLPEVNWHAVIDFCGYTAADINNLLPSLSPDKINHFIFISTTSVYASTRKLPVTEDAPLLTAPQPQLGPASDYGFQKHLSEKAVIRFCREKQIPYTIFRPTIIYGQYNYAPRENYFFDQILTQKPLFIPNPDLALFQFVFVEDVMNIIKTSIDNQAVYNKIFNLSAPELFGYRRLADILERISGRFIDRQIIPATEIDRRGIPLPFPFDDHLIYNGTTISESLNIDYTSFESGLQKTFDWYLGFQKARQ